MKTEIQYTSIDSLSEVRNETITGRRLEVYNAIRKIGECSNSMIAQELHLSIHKITVNLFI